MSIYSKRSCFLGGVLFITAMLFSSTVFSAPSADLSVTKTDNPATVVAGESLVYTITVTNAGPDNLTDVTVVDIFPAEAVMCGYTSSVTAGTASGNTAVSAPAPLNGIDDRDMSMEANSSIEYIATCTIKPGATAGEEILSNTVTAYSEFDSTPGGNAATQLTGVARQSELTIRKADNPTTVVAGENLVYTIGALNSGPSNAANLTITDATPAMTTFVSAVADGGGSCPTQPAVGGTGNVICTWADTAPSITRLVTLTVKVDPDHPIGDDNLSNTASVTSDSREINQRDNSVTRLTSVIRVSDLSVEKEADALLVVPGGNIKYTLSVHNAGPSDADNVVIKDTLPAGMTTVPPLPAGCVEDTGVVTCTLPSVPVTPSPTSIMLTLMAGEELMPIVNKVEITESESDEPPGGPTGPQEDEAPGRIVAAIPVEGTALIAVQKRFVDDNNETEVSLVLSCTTGDYDGTPFIVLPDNGPNYEKIFVISKIPLIEGEGATCTVIEEPVDGYETLYRCPELASMSPTDPSCQPIKDGVPLDNYACKYTDVQMGDANVCLIENVPKPVNVKVTKVWEEYGAGGLPYDRDVDIRIRCDAEIKDGYDYGPYWGITKDLDDSDGDYDDEDGVDVGMATVKVKVIPTWYPTVKKPTAANPQPATRCWAYEDGVPSSVEVTSDCGENYATAGMRVSIGNGDSCTITNTQFFEGIPTLNQYGMAIMALLMLGMGMVGFRRFV